MEHPVVRMWPVLLKAWLQDIGVLNPVAPEPAG